MSVDLTARHQEIQQQFTSRAPVYEVKAAWIPDSGLLNKFVELCKAGQDARLLDVCCGTGLVGGAFAGRVAHRTGFDLTQAMLDQAAARLEATMQGSVNDPLPFADGSFDVTVCRQALHFVESPLAVAREMFRVLRPGGQAIIGHRVPYDKEDAAWWADVNRSKQPLIKNLLEGEDVIGLLTGAGFEQVTSVDYFLEESIALWMDSPEASAQRDQVFELYRNVPPALVEKRNIRVTEDEVLESWRWILVSGIKPA